MAYLKLLLIVSMATCLLAESAEKKSSELADSDLDTDNTYGFGYMSPYLGLYGGLGYGGYSRFGWPNYYGGYYGGYGNPRYGYGYGRYGHGYGHGYYGGYPNWGGYYG